ncbi:hypothetical protein N7E81_04715 [Reichenbachiella carrageenanivorans]|uniref:WD40-like Beta Propeller Repeat n=1 Tax=Reichenbachiella carrageenanivorans TaxID=2979869 RepID=A0ABY6D2L0_9BACT|nr:hypothetical protein [Reichenbachiella carrageenanivorans]UXX80401.1 hypothetical protein N7E81_04715 [Reichenbachiella carrageenanivorans]
MWKQGALSVLVLVFLAFGLRAQELPNLPPSIKWQQINSEHFRIIFPKGLEEEAQRTTNILENVYEPASHSLGARPRKFPVVLQNQYAVSNGMVTIAPYRSEFYTFEPQSYRQQGNDRWIERLAVHEYRHMVQFEKAITPFNKVLYALMGEYGPFLASAAAAPQWFFEGDAVGVETAFGRSGRGRIPSFMMAFKANLIEKDGFNYYKQFLKSYRDQVPNHYVTGYLMTTYLKNKTGADVWDRIVGRSFAQPYIPFTFSNSMKKESGKHLVPTYNEMLAEQKQLYTNQLNQITPTAFDTLEHKEKKNFTNYYYPRRVYDGRVLAIKMGFSDIASLVLIDEQGKEESIFKLGNWQNPESLSSNDSTVVWAELELDPRWQRRTYSVIKKLNLKSKKMTRLTDQSKYAAPTISHNNQWLVAIDQSVEGQFEIHLLDAQNGQLIKSFENPDNSMYSVPQFDDRDEHLVLLKNEGEGKAVILKDIKTGEERTLYFSDKENLGTPILQGEWLYYATDHNGIDNIYAENIKSKENYQVTSSRFGAFSPRMSKTGELLYNEYTADGFEMAAVQVSPDSWTKKEEVKYVGFDFQEPMVEQEGHEGVLYNYSDSAYQITKYKKLLRSVRPHTWGLSTLPINNTYTIGMFSKDVLQTSTLSANATYNNDENVWRFVVAGSYQAWYPILDASFGYGARTVDVVGQNSIRTYSWDESEIKVGLRLPLFFTNSKYYRKVELGVSTDYIAVQNYDVPVMDPRFVRNGELIGMIYKASFQRLLSRSYLDLNSQWGQTLVLNYKQTPFGGDYQSEQFSVQTNLYFPGLFRHHSVRLLGGYQQDDNSEYQFASSISFTRGYSYRSYDHFVNLSFNYKMPLAYMDWHLGPVFNLRRVYINGFYDYGIGRNDTPMESDHDLKSYGAEVSFNFNLFRLLPLIDMGVRYSYLPTIDDRVFEIIFGGVTF